MLMIELGANVNEWAHFGGTALHAAAQRGYLDIVRANVSPALQNDATPLSMAARDGHLETVHALVAELGADVNQELMNPLWLAAEQGHLETVRLLAMTELGAHVNQAARGSSVTHL